MMRAIRSHRAAMLACLQAGVLTAALLLHGAASAQAQFEEDFDDTTKPWQEIVVQLPPLPKVATLLPFYVSATATQSFAIAPESLSVGSDGVVRYVMVARSQSGAENTSYDGLRCASLEHKSYAFGHTDGTWSRSRRTAWVPITGNAANRQYAALAESFFCEGGMVAGEASDIVKRLKKNRVLR